MYLEVTNMTTLEYIYILLLEVDLPTDLILSLDYQPLNIINLEYSNIVISTFLYLEVAK